MTTSKAAMTTVALFAVIMILVALVGYFRRTGGEIQRAARTTVTPEHATVDDYLRKWDQFAQGQNQLTPYLREHQAEFEHSLSEALAKDRSAVSRLVFYPVVQGGGSIPADSPLGVAALRVLGPQFNVTTTKEGRRDLFAGDLYLWWEKHQSEYPHFSTFDDWLARDFAQKTVLPMYRSVAQQPGQ